MAVHLSIPYVSVNLYKKMISLFLYFDLTRASCNICFSWAVYQTLLVSKLTCYLVNLGRWPRQSEFEIKRVLTNERGMVHFSIYLLNYNSLIHKI